MSSERGFFAELMHRRVPQFLGLFIAGVWLGIEIGDWLTDQFSLPERLTAYIFVFLAALLPSVALLAWRFGAPGKDPAKPLDKAFVPLNALIAIGCVSYMVVNPPVANAPLANGAPPPAVPAAPATQDIAPAARVQRVLVYFWNNKTSEAPDRLGYAMPFLIAEDMDRASTSFVVRTPFSMGGLVERLRQAGFPRVLDAPLTIQLREAVGYEYNFILRGEVLDAEDGAFMLKYELRDVAAGRVVLSGEKPMREGQMLSVADAISSEVQALVLEQFDEPVDVQDLPMEESMSDSVVAINHYIDARITRDIDSDLQGHIAPLEAAVAQDPKFAEAHAVLGVGYYLNAKSEPALGAIDTALKYDFRLSRDTKFRLRTIRATINNDIVGARDIARAWATADPNNVDAFKSVARYNQMGSLDLDEAQRALAKVRQLNPTATNTLQQSAVIEQQRGDLAAATLYTEQLIAAQPGNMEALAQLARIRTDALDFDGALEAYKKGQDLDDSSLTPILGSIGVLARRGDLAQAIDQLEGIDESGLTDQQRLEVMNRAVDVYGLAGRYAEVIDILERNRDIALQEMGPLMFSITFAPQQVSLDLQLGAAAEEIIAQLEAQRSELQPPWTHYLHAYDVSVHSRDDNIEAYQASLREFEKFAGAQTSNENLSMMLATLRAQEMLYLDDSERALAQLEKALELTRSSVLNVIETSYMFTVRADIYDMLRQSGDPQRAIRGLSSVVQAFPGHATAHFRLALAYADVGNATAAREALAAARDLWRNADATFVMIKEMEALDERLSSGV